MQDYAATQKRFALWIGLPPRLRPKDEKDQTSFAKKYDVSREQLSRWKKLPGFKDIVLAAGKSFVTAEDIQDIRLSMVTKAKNGNVNAAKLLDALTGGALFGTAPDKDEAPAEVGELSDEDLAALADGDQQ